MFHCGSNAPQSYINQLFVVQEWKLNKNKVTNEKDNFTNKANTWKSNAKWDFLPFEGYDRGEHFYIKNKSSNKVAFHLHFFYMPSIDPVL